MDNGWDQSAQGWIAHLGERGDWGRENILDPAMLARVDLQRFAKALDVGCGEGRFCRMLQKRGIATIGIDTCQPLLDAARSHDSSGDYRLASAESLPFDDDAFDLVVSYVTLCDIADFRAAIREMARVLRPGGTLLIANLTSMSTADAGGGWVSDESGRLLHWPVDRYLDEYSMRSEWKGISIVNWHRPLSAYMNALLETGLHLIFFDEPVPQSGEVERQERYRRMPWFLIMEWRSPG